MNNNLTTLENDITHFDPLDLSEVIIAPKNWSPTSIYELMLANDIDINPKFQRRNAWDDEKRSKLIESYMIGYPVPEIILAENPKKPHSFIVIDGKQRLTTIAGFINPELGYWENSRLKTLNTRQDLSGLNFEELEKNDSLLRRFRDIDIRCAIIKRVPNDDILYDMFYRLNSGSVPLNLQELRQVLYRGSFTDYLMEITDVTESTALHKVLGIENPPDNRLNDIEIILKFFANYFFASDYQNSLSKFLDNAMENINDNWASYELEVKEAYKKFDKTIENIARGFKNLSQQDNSDEFKKVGRLPVSSSFNKAVFEVQIYFFSFLEDDLFSQENMQKFFEKFHHEYDQNREFARSLTLATNSKKNYIKRFEVFQEIMNQIFEKDIKLPLQKTELTVK